MAYPLHPYKSAYLGLIGGFHGHPHGVSWLRTNTQGSCIVLAPSILRRAALAASGKREVRDLHLRRDLTHVRVIHGPRPALRVAPHVSGGSRGPQDGGRKRETLRDLLECNDGCRHEGWTF